MWKNTRRAFAPQRDWLVVLAMIAILIAVFFAFLQLITKKDRPVPYSQLAPLGVIVDSDTDSILIKSGDIVRVDGKIELITIFKKEPGPDGWQDFWVDVRIASSSEMISLPIKGFRNEMNGKHFTHIKKGTPEHTELMHLFEKK